MNIKLKSSEYYCLCEALRRYLKFHKQENINTAWVGLGHSIDYKQVIKNGYMKFVTIPAPHCMGWLYLTPLGVKILTYWMEQGYIEIAWIGDGWSGWEYPCNLLQEAPPRNFVVPED
jgi:hypothetical protein